MVKFGDPAGWQESAYIVCTLETAPEHARVGRRHAEVLVEEGLEEVGRLLFLLLACG